MTDIYDQHQKAFPRVSAYVIAKDGERVATIAFKFPVDGAGRLYAYVHWFGVTMVRGFAGGYGYDKRSAACADAARKLPDGWKAQDESLADHSKAGVEKARESGFLAALERDDGSSWNRRLEDAGFQVWSAL